MKKKKPEREPRPFKYNVEDLMRNDLSSHEQEGPYVMYEIGHDDWFGLMKIGEFAQDLFFTTGNLGLVNEEPGHCYVELFSNYAKYTITIHPAPDRKVDKTTHYVSLRRIGIAEKDESKAEEVYRSLHHEPAWMWVKGIALALMEQEQIKLGIASQTEHSDGRPKVREGVTMREFLKRWKIHWDEYDRF
jgi:hypothetical protein